MTLIDFTLIKTCIWLEIIYLYRPSWAIQFTPNTCDDVGAYSTFAVWRKRVLTIWCPQLDEYRMKKNLIQNARAQLLRKKSGGISAGTPIMHSEAPFLGFFGLKSPMGGKEAPRVIRSPKVALPKAFDIAESRAASTALILAP